MDDSNPLSREPLDPPEITITEPAQGDVAEPRPSTSNDVDYELLALLEEPLHSAPTIPAFFAPPPVREAAKKSGKAIGKIPITTTTVKTAPIRKGKPTGKAVSSRGGARSRGRGAAPKANSTKKSSLLAQAQENRARSLLRPQSVPPEGSHDESSSILDNRLYCICKSNYDDARIMIGCDRCDEWFHPHCVSLSDDEVDQIDLYVCPNCRKQNPHLQITRKTMCRRMGCLKSSRRQASKYCSNECGILAMASIIESAGLDKKMLWHAVKEARCPEGVISDSNGDKVPQSVLWARRKEFDFSLVKLKLGETEQQRQNLQRLIAVSDARQDLLDLALNRMQHLQTQGVLECGWDTRWLWDDNEIQLGLESGTLVKSYSAGGLSGSDDSHPPELASLSTWWCSDGRECSRHQGWIKVLQEDLELERTDLNAAQRHLAEREREVRIRMDNPDTAPTTTAISKDLVVAETSTKAEQSTPKRRNSKKINV